MDGAEPIRGFTVTKAHGEGVEVHVWEVELDDGGETHVGTRTEIAQRAAGTWAAWRSAESTAFPRITGRSTRAEELLGPEAPQAPDDSA